MLYKIVSFNEWVRYFVWNFKGALWNSTQNISAIQWKMCILLSGENLRDLRFKSVEAILKQMRTMKPIQTNLVYMGVYVCVMVSTKWWYKVLCLLKTSKYVFALLFRNFFTKCIGAVATRGMRQLAPLVLCPVTTTNHFRADPIVVSSLWQMMMYITDTLPYWGVFFIENNF